MQDKIALRLVESLGFGGGVVSLIYAPAIAHGGALPAPPWVDNRLASVHLQGCMTLRV